MPYPQLFLGPPVASREVDTVRKTRRPTKNLSMAGLASSFSTEVTLADTVMKPTVAHASWAFLDVIDKTTVLQYSQPLIVLGVAWFIYVFLAGPLYRKIEEVLSQAPPIAC